MEAPTHARTRDGQLHEIAELKMMYLNKGRKQFGPCSVVLVFVDGTQALARECTPITWDGRGVEPR